jgi:hypothetical protein
MAPLQIERIHLVKTAELEYIAALQLRRPEQQQELKRRKQQQQQERQRQRHMPRSSSESMASSQHHHHHQQQQQRQRYGSDQKEWAKGLGNRKGPLTCLPKGMGPALRGSNAVPASHPAVDLQVAAAAETEPPLPLVKPSVLLQRLFGFARRHSAWDVTGPGPCGSSSCSSIGSESSSGEGMGWVAEQAGAGGTNSTPSGIPAETRVPSPRAAQRAAPTPASKQLPPWPATSPSEESVPGGSGGRAARQPPKHAAPLLHSWGGLWPRRGLLPSNGNADTPPEGVGQLGISHSGSIDGTTHARVLAPRSPLRDSCAANTQRAQQLGQEQEQEQEPEQQLTPDRCSAGLRSVGGGGRGSTAPRELYRLQAVGHSLGAASLLIWAVTQRMGGLPHRLTRLVLLAPAGFHRSYPLACYPFIYTLPLVVWLMQTLRPGMG